MDKQNVVHPYSGKLISLNRKEILTRVPVGKFEDMMLCYEHGLTISVQDHAFNSLGYTPRSRIAGSHAGDIRNSTSSPGSGRSPGGGHGNPLQYSCLENPMDRGAWWATVHGVTKSQT